MHDWLETFAHLVELKSFTIDGLKKYEDLKLWLNYWGNIAMLLSKLWSVNYKCENGMVLLTSK